MVGAMFCIIWLSGYLSTMGKATEEGGRTALLRPAHGRGVSSRRPNRLIISLRSSRNRPTREGRDPPDSSRPSSTARDDLSGKLHRRRARQSATRGGGRKNDLKARAGDPRRMEEQLRGAVRGHYSLGSSGDCADGGGDGPAARFGFRASSRDATAPQHPADVAAAQLVRWPPPAAPHGVRPARRPSIGARSAPRLRQAGRRGA